MTLAAAAKNYGYKLQYITLMPYQANTVRFSKLYKLKFLIETNKCFLVALIKWVGLFWWDFSS